MKRRIKSYRKHSKRRAIERYNVSLNRAERQQIITLIKTGGTSRQRRLTNSRTLHEVDFKGHKLYPIYSKTTKEIVTFLTEEQAEGEFEGYN